MRETIDIIEQILVLINEDLGLSFLITAVKAYDKEKLPVPLTTTYFTVSCEENKATYFEDESSELCMKNTITIRINCFAPLRRIPYKSHGLSELVMKFVSDYYMPNVISSTVGDTEYDSNVKAFMVPCTLVLEFISCPGETSSYQELADAAKPFCKTHITDTQIHLSESDRSYLDAPYSIGSYTGNGSDGFLNISLGFRPSTVIAYRNSYHPTICDYGAKFTRCYFGIAAGSTYSKAVTTTANGFRVRNTVGTDTGTYLNEADAEYTYIAFK